MKQVDGEEEQAPPEVEKKKDNHKNVSLVVHLSSKIRRRLKLDAECQVKDDDIAAVPSMMKGATN